VTASVPVASNQRFGVRQRFLHLIGMSSLALPGWPAASARLPIAALFQQVGDVFPGDGGLFDAGHAASHAASACESMTDIRKSAGETHKRAYYKAMHDDHVSHPIADPRLVEQPGVARGLTQAQQRFEYLNLGPPQPDRIDAGQE